ADLTTQKVSIKYDKSKVNKNDMEKVIDSLGFELLGIDGQLNIDEKQIYQNDLNDKRNRIIVGFIFSAILTFLMYFPIHVPFITMGELSLIITIIPFLYVSLPILKAGFQGLFHRNLNMDVMYTMGILVAFISSILGTFNIILNSSFMFYETSLMLPSFLLIGRYLESKAKNKTSSSIKNLMGLQPKTAILLELHNNKIINQKEIPIDNIKVGDILLVKPGDKIPADAKVVGGSSYVDESMITGEPIPKIKEFNENVFAGTINQNGILKIEAQKIGKETILSQIITMVEKAQSSKPPVQRVADSAVTYFIPIILSIAITVFIIWYYILGSTLLFALTTFISILVVACPCALGLATPTAVTVGIGRSAEYGILIKNSDTLETAGDVDVAIFDKTGTITEGKPEVEDIISYGINENLVLKYVVSIENNSQHPIAKAIINKSNELNINLFDIDDFNNITGKGLNCKINGQNILVGNLNLLESENIKIESSVLETYHDLVSQNKTVIFLAIDEEVKGILTLLDKIKYNSKETINALHSMDISTYMITGDNEKTATIVADEVNIGNVEADVLPEDKLKIVKNIQKNDEKGKVLFVGDGINDAPALSQSDIGVAMGNGTDVAMESGDIVVVGGDLESVVTAIQLSNKVMSRIKENIFWAFAYNGILIPISAGVLYPTFGIMFRPEFAALAMAFSSVTVISLSLMLKRYVPPIKRSSN
ncbi:MAG: copper-translocating P-type ATPase, partial [Methanobacteriaceae archaeon]|nr:copper-translocating P-type ATPase [Methanobacteriaceae archaeon]